MKLTIEVHGRPAPQGSKRAYVNKHTGRVNMKESSEKVGPWREAVKLAAMREISTIAAWTPIDGPVFAKMTFYFRRPKSAPRRVTHPVTRASGDLSKLQRATEDALVDAGVLVDDSVIVGYVAGKEFCGDRATEGATIEIHAAVPREH